MKRSIILTVFILFTFTTLSFAQFTISGEYRIRGEANHGFKSLPVDSSSTAYYVSQRTRLNIKYNDENFTAYFSLQDVRFWGQQDIMNKTGIGVNTIGLDVSQAWFDWKFAQNWGLKTGRQIWHYDDGRIIAKRNWNQTALSWDAFLLHLDKKDFRFHFGSSINNTYASFNRVPDNPYDKPFAYRIKYFNFVWFNIKVNESLSLSINSFLSSYLKEGTTSTIYSMGTSGLYAEFNKKGLLTRTEAYYQYGKNGFGKEVSAYMASISAKYNLHKFKFGAGIDYLSGDKSSDNKYNAFDLMYGARFKFNGWMNYYNMASNTKHNGLVDIYPNMTYSINPKHQLYLTYHIFRLAQQNFSELTEVDSYFPNKNLGGELDLSYTYKFDKQFNIKALFSYYFATETTEYLKGVDFGASTSPYWFNLMLTFKPTLYTTKTK